MKKSRYKEEQIVSILREAESGTVTATARKHGVAEQTIYRWRRQFTGMLSIRCSGAQAVARGERVCY